MLGKRVSSLYLLPERFFYCIR